MHKAELQNNVESSRKRAMGPGKYWVWKLEGKFYKIINDDIFLPSTCSLLNKGRRKKGWVSLVGEGGGAC